MAAEFDAITAEAGGMDALLTIGWALKMNNLKVGSSEQCPAIVHQALQIVGIGGYKNDGKFALGRNYRDALSGALMISNDRIYAKTASMLLVYKDE
jgi:acyl-CoA dehydrogenase